MPNPYLCQCTMPAERMRGARLVTDFRDALTMARDGWTKAGAPVFNNGGTFDGTDDAVSCPHSILSVNSVGFWITLGSTTEEIMTLSATHSISVVAGVVTATGWAAPTVMVNGVATTAITTGRSYVTITTGTPFTANTISVGNIGAGFGAFKIERLGMWAASTVLSLAEHTAYYNQNMFDWQNRLSVNLPFGTAQYDISNVRTLDTSGHENHATLGDGAGTGEPTQGRGFLTLDGVNDYLSGIANPAGSYTVMGYEDTGTGWTFFSNNDLTKWTPIMTSGSFAGKLGHLAVAPEVLNATQLLDAEIALRQYGSEI